MSIATTGPRATGGTGTNASTFVAGPYQPVAGRWTVLAMAVGSAAGNPDPPSSVTGCGITWHFVGGLAAENSFRRSYAYVGRSTAPTSGSVTISFSSAGEQTALAYQILEYTGVSSTAGTTGAVVQKASTGGIQLTPSVTLGAFGSTGNGVIAIISARQAGSTITPEAGYTYYATTAPSIDVCGLEWRADNDTSPSFTFNSTADRFAMFAMEVRAAVGAGGLGTPVLAFSWADDLGVGLTVTPATGTPSGHTLHYGATTTITPTTANKVGTLGSTGGAAVHASTLGSTATPRPRTQHYYKAVALSTAGSSANTASAVLGARTAPKRPTGLTVTGTAETYIDTKWTDRTTGDRHRAFKRQSTTAPYSLDGLTTAGTTTWRYNFLPAQTAVDLAVASFATSWGQSGFATTVGQTLESARRTGGRHV